MSLEANFLLQRTWFPELIYKDHTWLLQPQSSELVPQAERESLGSQKVLS